MNNLPPVHYANKDNIIVESILSIDKELITSVFFIGLVPKKYFAFHLLLLLLAAF